ncbi:MAG: inorganic phosphate transporter [Phycisphaerae bacterium]|nr:inorganic phosphate transporter [Phycisphaerae bacterium]
MLYLILFIIFVALVFDFLNGFHDAANSIATIVCTRVLSPAQAVIWAAFFNFVAAFIFPMAVAKTIGGKMIFPEHINVFVVLGGLCGAIAWNIITWYAALPTSSSHALMGGLAGAAIVKAGSLAVLDPRGWTPVIIFIFVAPMIGFVFGYINMMITNFLCRNAGPRKVDNLFRKLQLVSAALYSLGHGANDAQKTMGIIIMLLIAAGHPEWTKPAGGGFHMFGVYHDYALWIILSCHAAIGLGTLSGGWRIVKTMGSRITRLQPIGGFCAETAGAIVLHTVSKIGIPVSTTHVITGSILGVGGAKNMKRVNWIWGEKIVMAWILTLPLSALIGAIVYWCVHRFVEPFFHVAAAVN